LTSHWASMPSDERMGALMRGTENAKSQAESQVGLMLKALNEQGRACLRPGPRNTRLEGPVLINVVSEPTAMAQTVEFAGCGG
jgi:hypothetical protein